MPTNLRTLGVRGKNANVKKSLTVAASEFNIAGIIGFFERKYLKAFEVNNPLEEREIFGDYYNANTYGKDTTKLFWDNLAGNVAKLWIKSHVGYTGSAIDAVVADTQLDDQASSPLKTLKIESAYKEELDYGISGNRTAVKITNGYRYSTAVASTIGVSDTSGVVDSVIGIKVGDIVRINATGGTPAVVFKKITQIDESTNTIHWTGAFDAAAIANVDDTVDVIGFKLQTYRKSLTGIETEVETSLGAIWCTMEPEVTDFYVQNVHQQNKWIKATDLSSASTLEESFPANTANPVYLTSGADGTTPTTSSHWSLDLTAFDNKPIRMITNCETSDESIQKAIETYCKSRIDTPMTIIRLLENQTKSQLKIIGSSYQRSDDVFMVNVAEWLKIDDPYNTSPNAPDRHVPNCGLTMSAWIRSIATNGIHYIPCVSNITLFGVNGLVNDNLGDIGDEDRTELAEYGINIIQFVQGSGYRIRNFFTPSTDTAYMFANGLLMRNYIKISSQDSLQSSENTPNAFNRINENKNAIRNFLLRLWYVGSTGNVPTGETFGQQQLEDGTFTDFSDHLEVIADPVNNPQSAINLGQSTIDAYFTYPTPAGSIQINVGILIR